VVIKICPGVYPESLKEVEMGEYSINKGAKDV
jgi:hypothetical protein